MSSNLPNIISRAQFNLLAPSPNSVYTYENLLAAGAAFPDFCSGPNGALELAAFIGNTNQETGAPLTPGYGTCSGGSKTCQSSADCTPPSVCGLNAFYYASELGCIDTCNDPSKTPCDNNTPCPKNPDVKGPAYTCSWPKKIGNCASAYCDPSYIAPVTKATYPCSQTTTSPNSVYSGRGPLQISWNYNYGRYGDAVGQNFIDNANAVLTGQHVFGTAVWFWMTSQGQDQGSTCHQAMQQNPPDFGRCVYVINGGLECTPPLQNTTGAANRVQYFKIAAAILNAPIPAGTNFDCQKFVAPKYNNQAWCGSSWADSQCRGTACFDGTNAKCQSSGTSCYLAPINFCGATWSDSYANMQNNQYPCYSGMDKECQAINASYKCNQVKYPYICGTDYANACANSKNPAGFLCNDGTNAHCPSGTTCFVMPDMGCPNYPNCQ
jgi:hypothetical protein